MKKVIRTKKSFTIHLILLILVGLVGMMSGCSDQCETTRRFIYHEPVTMSLDELRSDVAIVAPQPMETPALSIILSVSLIICSRHRLIRTRPITKAAKIE